MNYIPEQLLPEERRLLFALNKEDPMERHKIGHVRGDFDRNGTGFFTTWFPCYENLKNERFKAELQQVVDELRSDSEFPLLKNRHAMRMVCLKHPQNRVTGGWSDEMYGFKIATEHYLYFIRCYYGAGDYNFYVYCFSKDPAEDMHIAQEEKNKTNTEE